MSITEDSPRRSARKLRKMAHPPTSFYPRTGSSSPTKLIKPRLATVKDLPLPPPPPPDKEDVPKRRIFSLSIMRSKDKDLPPSPKKKFTLDPQSERPLPSLPPTSPTHLYIPSSGSELHTSFTEAYDLSAEDSFTDPDPHGDSSRVRRRWSLAIAMTSHNLSDEVFVQYVERIRRDSIRESVGCETCDHIGGFRGWESGWLDPEDDYEEDSPIDYTCQDDVDDKAWSSALHALLITRDLLRTERNYLASLTTLLESSPCSSPPKSTLSWPSHPPPSLMHTYLLDLIELSTNLLSAWEQEPTVAAAARVIVEREEEVERVMVGWCGVVGGWFVGDGNEKRRRRRLSKTRFPPTPPPSKGSFSTSSSSSHLYPITPTSRRSSTLSLYMSPRKRGSNTTLGTPMTAVFPATSLSPPPPPSSLRRNFTARSAWRKSMPSLASLSVHIPSIPPHSLSSSSSSDAAALAMMDELADSRRNGSELKRSSTFLGLGRGGIPKSKTALGLVSGGGYPLSSSVSADGHGYMYAQPGRSALELERSDGGASLGSGNKKVHSVRELAILPVQRVTRYALLYRDLLKYTPVTSPSRAILEQAAETAARIAQKCDRAQENAEFLWTSSK